MKKTDYKSIAKISIAITLVAFLIGASLPFISMFIQLIDHFTTKDLTAYYTELIDKMKGEIGADSSVEVTYVASLPYLTFSVYTDTITQRKYADEDGEEASKLKKLVEDNEEYCQAQFKEYYNGVASSVSFISVYFYDAEGAGGYEYTLHLQDSINGRHWSFDTIP